MNKCNLIVLIYHELCRSQDRIEYNYLFTQDQFEDHLVTINKYDYTVITCDSFLNCLKDSTYKKKKFLMITFDDGNQSDFKIASPLLGKYELNATFFITTDWINKKGFLQEEEIRELAQQGFSIQSHAKSHRFLDKLDLLMLHEELYCSKRRLEDIIAKEVFALSIPGGRLNRKVIQVASNVGYKIIYTSVPFQLETKLNLFLIGRIGMRYPFNLFDFNEMLAMCPRFIFKKKLEAKGKRLLKSLVGGKCYYFLWLLFNKKKFKII